MNFLLNERTGVVLPWNPVLASRSRNQLKTISEAEARRRLGLVAESVTTSPDDGAIVAPVAGNEDPQGKAFEDAKVKIEAFDDKEALDAYADEAWSVKLDRRTSLDKMKAVLIAAVADTFGVAP